MSRSVDETRREFLLRLAKSAAFVPPAVLSMDVGRAGASPAPTVQGQGQGAGQGGQQAAPVATQQTQQTTAPVAQQQATVGTLTPTASLVVEPARLEQDGSSVPWSPGASESTPPWSRRPPTQTGG